MNSRAVHRATAPLRVAVIGTGDVVRNWHIPAIKRIDELQLVAAMSQTQGRGEALCDEFGIPRLYGDVQSLAADPEIDFVIVASRDRDHVAHAISLMKAGKHVLVEKPAALNMREFNKLSKAYASFSGNFAVGYHLRHHDAHMHMRGAALYPRFNERLESIEIDWSYIAPLQEWRMNSQSSDWWAMSTLGTHCIDLAYWISNVSAHHMKRPRMQIRNDLYGQRDEEVDLQYALEWDNKKTDVSIKVSVIKRQTRRVTMRTSHRTIECIETLGPKGEGQLFVNGKLHPFVARSPYEAQLRDMLRSIKEGDEPLSDFHAAYNNVLCMSRLNRLRKQTLEE